MNCLQFFMTRNLFFESTVSAAVTRPNEAPAALIFFDETGKITITKSKTANLRKAVPVGLPCRSASEQLSRFSAFCGGKESKKMKSRNTKNKRNAVNGSKNRPADERKSIKNTKNKTGITASELAREFSAPDGTDPLGSYTGTTENRFDLPQQDADDL